MNELDIPEVKDVKKTETVKKVKNIEIKKKNLDKSVKAGLESNSINKTIRDKKDCSIQTTIYIVAAIFIVVMVTSLILVKKKLSKKNTENSENK